MSCAKDFAPLFHPRARFTDDTICTVANANGSKRFSKMQVTIGPGAEECPCSAQFLLLPAGFVAIFKMPLKIADGPR